MLLALRIPIILKTEIYEYEKEISLILYIASQPFPSVCTPDTPNCNLLEAQQE